ncbi:hypothetical protein G9X64_00930 [Rhizobium sophorae]|uniref:Transposase n=1 Tax=Rhizobium sophorae TaxID=1535242 RepID=A0A7Y3WCK8_9HYPH|nr:hypothetical protein [Rhizobium sophorae]MBX4862425.1 hypothetical protein [Rhizobium bangladeshense]NKK74881.1 hypothetical protein [Rhizobium leguminosarum bv. viciae]NNU35099.1 hypothetical protein [Rhizobium sophorae]
MVCTRYRPKDLKLARRHIVKAAHRIADQERVIRTLSLKGTPAGAAYALLDRLYDNQRRKLARLKLIEAMLNESMALPELRQACHPPGKTKTHLRLVSPAAANSGNPDRLP